MSEQDPYEREAAKAAIHTLQREIKTLRERVKELEEASLDWFIQAQNIKTDLKTALQWIDDGVDQEGRDLIVDPLNAKYFQTND